MVVKKSLCLTLTALFFPAALAAAPFDRGWIKERVLDKLSDVLGRRIEVQGDIDIDLSWTPSLRAEQVRIENAGWSDNPYMAELGVLEASIDLGRLLKGQLVIPELTVLEPRLLLEVSSQNQANWHFAAPADETLPGAQDIAESALDTAIEELEKNGEPRPDPSVEENAPDLPLIRQLRVEAGHFRYLNHTDDVDLEGVLESVNGRMDADKTNVDINFTLENQPVSVNIDGGSFYALNRTDRLYPLTLDIQADDFHIALQGNLRNPLNLGGGGLDLTVEGEGMPALVNAWTGSELPSLPEYRLQAKMEHDGVSLWQLTDLNSHFGDTDLSGALSLDTAGSLPRVKAQLHSDTFDAAELNAIASGLDLGEDKHDNQPVVIDVTPLHQINAEFALEIVNLIAPGGVKIDDVAMQAQLEDSRLELQPLQLAIGGGSVSGELSLHAAEVLTGKAQLMLSDIDLDQSLDTLSQENDGNELGVINGSTQIRLVETGTDNGTVELQTLLDHLRLDDSELHYQDPGEGTDLQLDMAVIGEQHELSIKASGELQHQRVVLDIQGGPITELYKPGTPYEISGNAALGGLQGNIAGAVRQHDDIWQLQDFELGFGNSRLYGEAKLDLSSARPRITGDFTSPLLDLAELNKLGIELTDGDDQSDPTQPQAEAAEEAEQPAGLEALQSFDADLSLELDKMVLPGLELNDAGVDLTLEDGKLAIDPLRAELGGNALSLSGSLNVADGTPSGQFTLDLGAIDLTAMASAFSLEQPLPGQLTGKLIFDITGRAPANAANLAVPGIGRINIESSQLHYTAPALDIEIDATLSSRVLQTGKQQLVVEAGGRYRSEPFSLSATGGSPLLLTGDREPYPLEAELTAAETTVKVSGQLPQPLDADNFSLNLAVSGPDPGMLKPLLGFALPQLPPYDLEGELSRQGDIIKLNDFSGRVGDSDLGGDIRIETDTEPLTFYATMYSDRVDLDDLAGLTGGTPDADPGETASAEQRKENIRKGKSPNLLSDKPLSLQKITDAIQGIIKFSGKRVEAPKLPIDDIAVTMKIGNGMLTLDPLTFGVGDGTVESTLSFNTRKQPVAGRIESEIRRVNLKKLLAPFEIANDSLGMIGGRIKLWVYGDSVADFFASADGGLFLLMRGGRLDVILTELAGLDVGEALVALAGDVESLPIDCAYVDTYSEKGVLTVDTAVVDTSDTVFFADGFINFKKELVEIVVKPQPKDISLLSFRSPLHIEGRLKNPSVYPGSSALLARGIASVLLGIASPFAALLPLLEPGTGQDTAYCDGLIKAIDRAR